MKYHIEERPAFKVAGYVKKVKEKEAFKVIPTIWKKAFKDGTIEDLTRLMQQADYCPGGFLGVADAKEGQEEFDYILGVTNFVNEPDCIYIAAELGMQEFSYPASKWVIVEADGKLPEAVQNIYGEFYDKWLATSGCEVADLPVIECYKAEEKQEVWFAIK